MAKEIKQFKKDIESIKLSSNEKLSLKADFMNMLENTNVVKEKYSEPVASPFSVFFMKKYVAFGLSAFLVIGTGTTYASESSIPGDALYPIKINVVEKISSISDITDEEKIDTKIQLTEKRLVEAKKLLSKKKYDFDSSAYIENKFNEYSGEINSFIESSKNGENKIRSAETIIKFKKVLNNYDEELIQDAEYSADDNQVVLVKSIASKISLNIKDLNDDQIEIVKSIKEEDSQDSLKSEAEIKKEAVENILKEKNKNKEDVDDENTEGENMKIEAELENDSDIKVSRLDEKQIEKSIDLKKEESPKTLVSVEAMSMQAVSVTEDNVETQENVSVSIQKINPDKEREEDEDLDFKYKEANNLYESKKYLEAFVKFEEIEDKVKISGNGGF